jgi:Flp pilus assembly protein TadG
MRASRFCRRFWRDQGGAGTAFSVFLLVICAALGGLALDFSNAWRHREVLKTTADVAAQAGVIALAEGEAPEAARATALAALEFNTPPADYGRIVVDAALDVVPLHYDSDSNSLSADGSINAVSVLVRRTGVLDNAVPTYLLRLVGRRDWEIGGQSVAALVPTRRCNAADGVFAAGSVTLSQHGSVGAGFCIHSQDRVVLPQSGDFRTGSGLSMPDLAACEGLCREAVPLGDDTVAFETNLILADPAPLVDATFQTFADPFVASPVEQEFFASRPLAADLSALDEVGVDLDGLDTGSLVTLSLEQFSRLRQVPEGLIYRVKCTGGAPNPPGNPAEAQAEGQAGGQPEEQPGHQAEPQAASQPGRRPERLEISDGGNQSVLRNVAVVTDCALHFTAAARVEGALFVSTRTAGRQSRPTVTADAGARFGNPDRRCDAGLRSTLMIKGDAAVPADFLASNADLVAAGDLRVAAASVAQTVEHRGLGLHVGGEVSFASAQGFSACGLAPAGLLPELLVIRHVMPGLGTPPGSGAGTGSGAGDEGGSGGTSMSR